MMETDRSRERPPTGTSGATATDRVDRREEETRAMRPETRDSRHQVRETREDGRDARHVVDRERQHDEYGGFNIGAAFFGWLVAIGIAVLLTALLSAAGAAIGLTELDEGEAEANADTISLVGGALLLLVLAIAYYAGGYVAGRMSRFDGGRQGTGVWAIGLLVTLVLAVLGAIAGSEYNVLAQLDLPRIPIDEGSLATGGVIALILAIVITLIAAILGGKLGERYHRKVDRAGRPGY